MADGSLETGLLCSLFGCDLPQSSANVHPGSDEACAGFGFLPLGEGQECNLDQSVDRADPTTRGPLGPSFACLPDCQL